MELNVPDPSLPMAGREYEEPLNSQGTFKSNDGWNVLSNGMTKIKQQEEKQISSKGTMPIQAEIGFKEPPVPDNSSCIEYKECENTMDVSLKKMIPQKKVKMTEIDRNNECTSDVNKKKTIEIKENENEENNEKLMKAVSFQNTDDHIVDNGMEDAVDDIMNDGKESPIDESVDDRNEVAVTESFLKEAAIESINNKKAVPVDESVENRNEVAINLSFGKKLAINESINNKKEVPVDERIGDTRNEVAVNESFGKEVDVDGSINRCQEIVIDQNSGNDKEIAYESNNDVFVDESIDNRRNVVDDKSIPYQKEDAVDESINGAIYKSIKDEKVVLVDESVEDRNEIAINESFDKKGVVYNSNNVRKVVVVDEITNNVKKDVVYKSIDRRKKVVVDESKDSWKELTNDQSANNRKEVASVGKGKEFANDKNATFSTTKPFFIGLLLILGMSARAVGGKIVHYGPRNVEDKGNRTSGTGEVTFHVVAKVWSEVENDIITVKENDTRVGDFEPLHKTAEIDKDFKGHYNLSMRPDGLSQATFNLSQSQTTVDISSASSAFTSMELSINWNTSSVSWNRSSLSTEISTITLTERYTLSVTMNRSNLVITLEEGSVDSGLGEGSADSGLGESSVDNGLGKGERPVEYRLSKDAKAGIAVLMILLISSNIVWTVCWRKNKTGAARQNGHNTDLPDRNGTENGAARQNGHNTDLPDRNGTENGLPNGNATENDSTVHDLLVEDDGDTT